MEPAVLVENQGRKVRKIEEQIRKANRDRKRNVADCTCLSYASGKNEYY